jgi:hypothetical protein
MTSGRILRWSGITVIAAAALAASSAYALTTMDAPINSNGARYASPDADQQIEQQLNGQTGDNQRGFSIQVRPQPQDNDPNVPFNRKRSFMPWLPGQPFPSR